MKRLLSLTLLAVLLVAGVGCDSNEEENIDGDASVTGRIINSQTGDGLADALVAFARGGATREDRTDDDGEFTIDGIATGSYTVTISAEGFIDRVINDFEVGTGANEFPQGIVITEAPPAGAYRIVLSWDEQPRDLDSHLTGPDGQGDRFHVYFSDRAFGDVANLDRDDVTSFGPETTTLTPEAAGLYRYSVHNFSTQSESGSEGIAGEIEDSSPALVQVYTEGELLREYTAPDATPGNTWRVFEMSVSGDGVSFNDVNEYVDANYSDAGDFRMSGK
jgi:uncharacterized protein YfaP (DUF2135 family)